MKSSFLSILLLSVVLSACAKKSETDPAKVAMDSNKVLVDTMKKSGAPDFSAETKFAVKTADNGMLEVQLSEYAAKNATSKKVKDLAKNMVKDHTAANKELMAMAATKNITLPAALGESNQKTYNDITKKTGTDFDKAYVEQIVSGHKDAISDFESQAKDSKDADIKAWAGKTLPALIHHLDMAKTINDKM